MTPGRAKKDKHFPLFVHDNPLRRLLSDPRTYCCYVKQDQTVANLGCGPGFYTLGLAESVGPKGRVYAVDSDEKAVRAVEKKAVGRGLGNVETHASSAADLGFIKNGSVDFVLAGGLLCSMAPQDRDAAVKEIKRIMKPGAKAFLSAARDPWSYMDDEGWETILEGFNVERRNYGSWAEERRALVSKKHA